MNKLSDYVRKSRLGRKGKLTLQAEADVNKIPTAE
jgi:hypothetical protein